MSTVALRNKRVALGSSHERSKKAHPPYTCGGCAKLDRSVCFNNGVHPPWRDKTHPELCAAVYQHWWILRTWIVRGSFSIKHTPC